MISRLITPQKFFEYIRGVEEEFTRSFIAKGIDFRQRSPFKYLMKLLYWLTRRLKMP